MASDALTVHAVILAGGRGTRFWPRSRTRTPKQLLNIVGKQTMLEQTVARLRPLIPIERMGEALDHKGFPVYAVRRFTEKPALSVAKVYAGSGDYHWNAGMFFWRASTFLENLDRHLPKTFAALESLGESIGKSSYERNLRAIYPKLQNISVDYAILEPATRHPGSPSVFVIPAEVGWSDIGSWAAVYELLTKYPGENILPRDAYSLDASGNLFWSTSKFVAAVGVNDLLVVETPDALLICPRERAQDVGKIVKWLEDNRRKDLL